MNLKIDNNKCEGCGRYFSGNDINLYKDKWLCKICEEQEEEILK